MSHAYLKFLNEWAALLHVLRKKSTNTEHNDCQRLFYFVRNRPLLWSCKVKLDRETRVSPFFFLLPSA